MWYAIVIISFYAHFFQHQMRNSSQCYAILLHFSIFSFTLGLRKTKIKQIIITIFLSKYKNTHTHTALLLEHDTYNTCISTIQYFLCRSKNERMDEWAINLNKIRDSCDSINIVFSSFHFLFWNLTSWCHNLCT